MRWTGEGASAGAGVTTAAGGSSTTLEAGTSPCASHGATSHRTSLRDGRATVALQSSPSRRVGVAPLLVASLGRGAPSPSFDSTSSELDGVTSTIDRRVDSRVGFARGCDEEIDEDEVL